MNLRVDELRISTKRGNIKTELENIKKNKQVTNAEYITGHQQWRR